MDSILKLRSILSRKNWLFYKLYKNPTSSNDWKSNLDWYHQILLNIVKPTVNNNPEIRVVFFGFYGPKAYDTEGETYERKIDPPSSNVDFIRLRVSVKRGRKRHVKSAFRISINQNRNIVWDYESMVTYNVSNDLGTRFGSSFDDQTLEFVRYWDAACRYILSILTFPGNWTQNVDVWGIPHVVNNSLGAWLRPERAPVLCPNCQTHMYMSTAITPVTLGQPITSQIRVPHFLFVCPNCSNQYLNSTNI